MLAHLERITRLYAQMLGDGISGNVPKRFLAATGPTDGVPLLWTAAYLPDNKEVGLRFSSLEKPGKSVWKRS